MGAITQVRVLGGIIGLSIVQAILISSLRSALSGVLTEQQLDSILSSATDIASLPPATALQTRAAYGNASNFQMRIVAGFAAASLLVSLLTWRRNVLQFSDVAKGDAPADSRKPAAAETGAARDVAAGLEDGRDNDIRAVQMNALDAGSKTPARLGQGQS